MKIENVIDDLWDDLYNEHSLKGVLIVSYADFERVMKDLKSKYKDDAS